MRMTVISFLFIFELFCLNFCLAIPSYCVYNGSQFEQGEIWFQGCDKKCRCDDTSNNSYTCENRCTKLWNVPYGCTFIPDPRDSCCSLQVCQPVAQSIEGSISGQTHKTGETNWPSQTLKPQVGTALQPDQNDIPVLSVLSAVPVDIICQDVKPAPIPGMTPSPNPVCVYRGVSYQQGARWQDGCDYKCECIDANTRKYKCTERCVVYKNLQQGCTLTNDPNDPCCKLPVCQAVPTARPISNQTPRPGGTSSPGQTLVPHPGTTFSPNPIVTPVPTISTVGISQGVTTLPGKTPNPNPVCVYKGVSFRQGVRWYDGCVYICECIDADTGLYRCNERCVVYQNLPKGCTLETDPNDSCCSVPVCQTLSTSAPTSGQKIGPTALPMQGQTPVPQPATTLSPNPIVTPPPLIFPTVPSVVISQSVTQPPVPTPDPFCFYDGSSYLTGETWQDGCLYECECLDSDTNWYSCTDRCMSIYYVPGNCRTESDPFDVCCDILVCDPTPDPNVQTPVPTSDPTPDPNVQTPVPTSDPTSDTNVQTTVPTSIPTSDPNVQTPVPTPGQITAQQPSTTLSSNPYATRIPHILPTAPAAFICQAVTPNPQPGQTPSPNPNSVCVHKGVSYHQHDTWKDGCDHNCECIDVE